MAVRSPKRSWLLAAITLAGVVLIALSGLVRPPRKQAAAAGDAEGLAFRRAWWYWHHPFRLSAEELKTLQAARCDRLYVHAGNLVLDGGALALTGRQRFEAAAPCELYAVVRVQPRTHDRVLGPGGADSVADLLRNASLPEVVRGLQLDADIPTAQLPAYARFLAELRVRLPHGWALSITALPDWLRSRDYPRLCSAVDEIAPQFYGNRWPTAGKPPPPLWETDGLLEQVRRSASGSAQVWVGLPSYGRCVVLDPSGCPIGVRHDVDPMPLLDEVDWRVRVSTSHGASPTVDRRRPLEDTLALHADRDAEAGPLGAEAGSTLWFQWPRVGALQEFSRAIEALREPRVAGVCFFRWPAPGEPLAVTPRSVEPSMAGLAVTTTRRGREVLVTVMNHGVDAPLLTDGVRVEIETAGAEVQAASDIEYRLGETPCSPLRADRAVLSRAVLRPGASWEVCRLRDAEDPVPIRASWRDGEGRMQVVSAVARPTPDGSRGNVR